MSRFDDLVKECTKEVWGNDSYNGAPSFEGFELDKEMFYEMIVNHAVECVRDVVRTPRTSLTWEGCVEVQARIREFFEVKGG